MQMKYLTVNYFGIKAQMVMSYSDKHCRKRPRNKSQENYPMYIFGSLRLDQTRTYFEYIANGLIIPQMLVLCLICSVTQLVCLWLMTVVITVLTRKKEQSCAKVGDCKGPEDEDTFCRHLGKMLDNVTQRHAWHVWNEVV